MSAALNTPPSTPHDRVFALDYGVVGLGVSGQSVLRFLMRSGARVIAMDSRAAPPGLAQVRAAYPEVEMQTGKLDGNLLCQCAIVVVSPGIPLNDPALVAARSAGCEIYGDIELFARHASAPIVAITGTNGKSTVTMLVADILAASGFETRCGGNIGTPALDLLQANEPDFYVLELSSFQLDLTNSLSARVACVLNVAPDHLDRHGTFENYARAKARILERCEIAITNVDDAVAASFRCPAESYGFSLHEPRPRVFGVRSESSGDVLASTETSYLRCNEIALIGTHNVANVLAAIAIGEACNVDRQSMCDVIRGFRGLEHRAEIVASRNGITFINDSKATNPAAACATIAGLMRSTNGVVIAGGEAKGATFTEFADTLVAHAHTVVLIGQAGAEIAAAIDGRIGCLFAADMATAVVAATGVAGVGEIVLLAPACASFDMFKNYAARGAAFRDAVSELVSK